MRASFVFVLAIALSACGGDGGSSGPDGAPQNPDSGACDIPQQAPAGASNDPRCPSTYGGASLSLCTPRQPCPALGLTCRYYGVGDGLPGCYAIAEMWCNAPSDADAGTGPTWVCAN